MEVMSLVWLLCFFSVYTRSALSPAKLKLKAKALRGVSAQDMEKKYGHEACFYASKAQLWYTKWVETTKKGVYFGSFGVLATLLFGSRGHLAY